MSSVLPTVEYRNVRSGEDRRKERSIVIDDEDGGRGGGRGGWPVTRPLWPLLALIVSLFSAHYLLVQKTLSEAFEKLRSEITLQQSKMESVIQYATRDNAILLQRVSNIERDLDDARRQIVVIQERQAVVRQKLNLRAE